MFILNLMFFIAPFWLTIFYLSSGLETDNYILATSGILVAIAGRIITLIGAHSLRTNRSKKLVQKSIFRFSRNPISLGTHITFFGLVLIFNFWILWMGWAIYVVNLHTKIKAEEKVLMTKYPKDYKDYRNHVPRYLII